MVALLLAALFFQHPAPLKMPSAKAYLVTEKDRVRLEDRYDETDLWTARTVLGRWTDDEGRTFTLSRPATVAPKFESRAMTREEYGRSTAPLKWKQQELRAEAVRLLSPVPIADVPVRPHQKNRGYREVVYYHGTNTAALVCAFAPEKTDDWYLASWELAEGDSFPVAFDEFDREFLDVHLYRQVREVAAGFAPLPEGERELLRADARHSVANYGEWHVTDAREFTVLDDLPRNDAFIEALTNELTTMRAKYAAALPSPIDGSNVLAVARIFASRAEYLDEVGEELAFSAAHWNPLRRELVAYLPSGSTGATDALLKTFRHEAFHQYLSYATAMASASPWLNEGYAEYFEDVDDDDWGEDFQLTPEAIDRLGDLLPALMAMDYDQFYDGTAAQRREKYRLAWSIARFLEFGAPKVRFQPFRELKADYVQALLATHDMRAATAAALGTPEKLRLFVTEWKKYWKDAK